MEKYVTLAIPALLTVILIRGLLTPMKLICKLGLRSAAGLCCLLLLNTVSGFTGVLLPINAVTVLIAGTLGVPGMALIALIEVL